MKIEMQNVNALVLREKDWSVHLTKRNDGSIMLDLVSKYRNGQELTLVENSYNLNTLEVTEIVKFLSTNFTQENVIHYDMLPFVASIYKVISAVKEEDINFALVNSFINNIYVVYNNVLPNMKVDIGLDMLHLTSQNVTIKDLRNAMKRLSDFISIDTLIYIKNNVNRDTVLCGEIMKIGEILEIDVNNILGESLDTEDKYDYVDNNSSPLTAAKEYSTNHHVKKQPFSFDGVCGSYDVYVNSLMEISDVVKTLDIILETLRVKYEDPQNFMLADLISAYNKTEELFSAIDYVCSDDIFYNIKIRDYSIYYSSSHSLFDLSTHLVKIIMRDFMFIYLTLNKEMFPNPNVEHMFASMLSNAEAMNYKSKYDKNTVLEELNNEYSKFFTENESKITMESLEFKDANNLNYIAGLINCALKLDSADVHFINTYNSVKLYLSQSKSQALLKSKHPHTEKPTFDSLSFIKSLQNDLDQHIGGGRIEEFENSNNFKDRYKLVASSVPKEFIINLNSIEYVNAELLYKDMRDSLTNIIKHFSNECFKVTPCGSWNSTLGKGLFTVSSEANLLALSTDTNVEELSLDEQRIIAFKALQNLTLGRNVTDVFVKNILPTCVDNVELLKTSINKYISSMGLAGLHINLDTNYINLCYADLSFLANGIVKEAYENIDSKIKTIKEDIRKMEDDIMSAALVKMRTKE